MSGGTTHPGTQLIDTSVMPTLHTFFRRELRLAGGVIRGVAEGDRRRAKVVCNHLDFLARSLHRHHGIEDDLLWPKLLERVPEELASTVHLMESQHERIDAYLQEIREVLPTFRATADSESRERLSNLFDTLHVDLVEHLDAEEDRLLPIAARTLTQSEWDEMGEAGREAAPRKERALVLGMYQYEGSPEVIAEMLAEAPAPVRWVVRKLSKRAFRKHARRIHGTATP